MHVARLGQGSMQTVSANAKKKFISLSLQHTYLAISLAMTG